MPINNKKFLNSYEMSNKLSRAQREKLIFDHLKGLPTPGYDVTECSNGKYLVKPIRIEVEEEEEDEENEDNDDTTNEDSESSSEEHIMHRSPTRRSLRKQNARELLEQLSQILSDDDDDDIDMTYVQPPPRINSNVSWHRRRLRF